MTFSPHLAALIRGEIRPGWSPASSWICLTEMLGSPPLGQVKGFFRHQHICLHTPQLPYSQSDQWKCSRNLPGSGVPEEWRSPRPGRPTFMMIYECSQQRQTKHGDTQQLARTSVKANTMQVQNKMAKSSAGEKQGWHKWDGAAKSDVALGEGPPPGRNLSCRTGENQIRHIIY